MLETLENKPIKSIFNLEFDVGRDAPHVTSLSLSSSFSGYDYLDLDVGFVLYGDHVHLDAEINIGGDDLPDVRAKVTRLGVDGNMRLKLGPLITPLPCASVLRVGFTARSPSVRRGAPSVRPSFLLSRARRAWASRRRGRRRSPRCAWAPSTTSTRPSACP